MNLERVAATVLSFSPEASLASRAGPSALLALVVAMAAAEAAQGPWKKIAPFFRPPPALAGDLGSYRSPLIFSDGRRVKSAADWRKRREEILRAWHETMGPWPPLIQKPALEALETQRRKSFTQKKVRVEVAPGRMLHAYLLVPDGAGPFPAVLVVYYDAESGAGLRPEKRHRDFGYQLTRRGFVSLSIGNAGRYVSQQGKLLQPLSYLAYAAANCYNALAALPEVHPERVGVVGHSFGGKWAMFAACLHEEFACAVWSDPGIVFDEQRPNVNYWEPWYLGLEPRRKRKPGIPTKANPRTGAYKRLIAGGRDLHELHALMAPRPFLVSGGSEDRPERWKALNHAIAVNRLLGREDRVAMTNRKGHSTTQESNEQIYLFFEHFLSPASKQQAGRPAKQNSPRR